MATPRRRVTAWSWPSREASTAGALKRYPLPSRRWLGARTAWTSPWPAHMHAPSISDRRFAGMCHLVDQAASLPTMTTASSASTRYLRRCPSTKRARAGDRPRASRRRACLPSAAPAPSRRLIRRKGSARRRLGRRRQPVWGRKVISNLSRIATAQSPLLSFLQLSGSDPRLETPSPAGGIRVDTEIAVTIESRQPGTTCRHGAPGTCA